MGRVCFSNPYFGTLSTRTSWRVQEYYPRQFVEAGSSNQDDIISAALEHPYGVKSLADEAKTSKRTLILVDDKSRSTPVRDILSHVLNQLKIAGVKDSSITILVALGTHRSMSTEELIERVGPDVFSRIRTLNHCWDDPNSLQYLGLTAGGIEIWVNKLAVEADFIIGIGHIVPHRVAGYSGGGKIVQPGISGPVTTGKTHWLSAYYSAEAVLGKAENPVRREIEEVARRVGLNFIVNVVQDNGGKTAGVFAGDPIVAHRAGCAFAETIYGVRITQKADIVISEAYPAESELWLATKALQAADIVVKPGGVIILLAECPEGISCSHGPLIEQYGFRPLKKVEELIERGVLKDLNVASYLARVGNVLEGTRTILVSRGITREQGEKIGFIVCGNPEEALQEALALVPPDPEIAVLHQGSELLPIISK